jgi:hypothetical protein
MSGSFKDVFGGHFDQEDETTYVPWRTCQQGATMYFKLVPPEDSDEPERHIPYLQPITIEHHRQTGQLCLLCHSTGMTVFIEGRGLAELANQIAEKRVKSVHVFDAGKHQPLGNDAAVILGIIFEMIST